MRMRARTLCGYSAGIRQDSELLLASNCRRAAGANPRWRAPETRSSDKPPAAIVRKSASCSLAFKNKSSSLHSILLHPTKKPSRYTCISTFYSLDRSSYLIARQHGRQRQEWRQGRRRLGKDNPRRYATQRAHFSDAEHPEPTIHSLARDRKKNEALAARIFGKDRRSSTPASKSSLAGSLASRAGVKKVRLPD